MMRMSTSSLVVPVLAFAAAVFVAPRARIVTAAEFMRLFPRAVAFDASQMKIGDGSTVVTPPLTKASSSPYFSPGGFPDGLEFAFDDPKDLRLRKRDGTTSIGAASARAPITVTLPRAVQAVAVELIDFGAEAEPIQLTLSGDALNEEHTIPVTTPGKPLTIAAVSTAPFTRFRLVRPGESIGPLGIVKIRYPPAK